ncbi:xylosylprotein 4-beta-galactosyltransferase-like [Planococcus citri]|uniref:xylosylprotein 4-beta-galactosyltransferase-like n=1 Tax=Planococcus citri TaxID=170843 RepID=UPI0031F74688
MNWSTSLFKNLFRCKASHVLIWCSIIIIIYIGLFYFSSSKNDRPTLEQPEPIINQKASYPEHVLPALEQHEPNQKATYPEHVLPSLEQHKPISNQKPVYPEHVLPAVKQPKSISNQKPSYPEHVLCVLVTYRERFEHLLEFVPHMSRFLNHQSITYHIIVINHLPDGYRFNKGSSYNAGFLIMEKKFPECDYIALHDIDTLPLNVEIPYTYPGNGGFHPIPMGYHPIRVYSNPYYISGIFLMSSEQFRRMNGYGNNFWGWGFEDYDFYLRVTKYSIPWTRLQPDDISTDQTNSFKHLQSGATTSRDAIWCGNQAQASGTRDRTDHTGLSDVNFTIASENVLTIDGFPVYLFNIHIKCIFKITPWCKPFCVENLTLPKTIWELTDYSARNPQMKPASFQSNPEPDSAMWDKIWNNERSTSP